MNYNYRVRIKLSRILGDLRISQADLADMCHIRANTMCRIVNEEVYSISLEDIAAICEVLEVSIGDIFELEAIGEDACLIERERRIREKAKSVQRERNKSKNIRQDSYYYREYIRQKAQQRNKRDQ